MATPASSQPRIVCTKCPAVVIVHYCDDTENDHEWLVWVECHGEHVFGRLPKQLSGYTGGPGYLMDHITVHYNDAEIARRFEVAERRMLEFAELAKVYQRFLSRRG